MVCARNDEGFDTANAEETVPLDFHVRRRSDAEEQVRARMLVHQLQIGKDVGLLGAGVVHLWVAVRGVAARIVGVRTRPLLCIKRAG